MLHSRALEVARKRRAALEAALRPFLDAALAKGARKREALHKARAAAGQLPKSEKERDEQEKYS